MMKKYLLFRRQRSLSMTMLETIPAVSKRDSLPAPSSASKQKSVVLSKECLDFGLGDGACPVNEQVKDVVSIVNNTGKKIKFHFEPVNLPNCKITFEPSSGTVSEKQKNKEKKILVKMILTSSEGVNLRLNLKINGSETLFLAVRTHCEAGVYGVDPATLELMEDAGYEVPRILVEMKQYLVSQNAWNQEGIFRLAGESYEIKSIKQQINNTRRLDTSSSPDINSIANLLKIFFRDLPVPILNELPPEAVFNSTDLNACVDAFESLKEPQRSLLGWLLDLMADVSSNKLVNKMSEQNLAIVVAPNLYDPPGCDPMEGLVLSQKAVQFTHHLLLHEIELRKHPHEEEF